MKNKLHFMLVMVLVSFGASSQVETISMHADYDVALGYHDGYQTSDNNYDDALQNAAYCIPGESFLGGVNSNRCLIYFDLSSIPEGSEITNAYVSLYALGPISDLPGHMGPLNQCVLERVIEPWSENTVTWNNQPETTAENAAILPPTSDYTLDYDSIDVTAMVQEMVMDLSSSYGFKLRLENEVVTYGLLFCSKECNDSDRWPMLTVSYKEERNAVSEVMNSSPPVTSYINQNNQLVLNTGDAYIGTGILQVFDLKGALVNSCSVNISSGNQGVTITSIVIENAGCSYGKLIMNNGVEQSFRIIAL